MTASSPSSPSSLDSPFWVHATAMAGAVPPDCVMEGNADGGERDDARRAAVPERIRYYPTLPYGFWGYPGYPIFLDMFGYV